MTSGYFTGLRPTARACPEIPKAEDARPSGPETRKLCKKRVEKGQEVVTTIDSSQGKLSGEDGKEGWQVLGLQSDSGHRGEEGSARKNG